MTKTKEEIRVDLILKAREILKDKGLEFLTARKLAEYSGYSVGTIYNQYKSMDNLMAASLETLSMQEDVGEITAKNIVDKYFFIFSFPPKTSTLYHKNVIL